MNQQSMKPTNIRNIDFKSCHPQEVKTDCIDTGFDFQFPPSYHNACLTKIQDEGFILSTKKRHVTNGCFTSCLLVCCIVCVPLSVYTFLAMAAMEARLSNAENMLVSCTTKSDVGALSRQQNIADDNRSMNQVPPFLTRERRNAGSGQMSSFVHLVGRGSTDYSQPEGNMTIFKWDRSVTTRRLHGLSLQPNAQDISRIKILHSGVYLVYAQVEVHGRQDVDVHYYCSHRTIYRRGYDGWLPLLSSLLTQDNLGRRYHGLFSDQNHKPIDSQLHMGVFHLLANDELAVQLPFHCSNTDYSMTAGNSYFGVAKIG